MTAHSGRQTPEACLAEVDVIITSAADHNYEALALAWRESVFKFGHEERMYNLGGLSFGVPIEEVLDRKPQTHSEIYHAKPACMQHAREVCSGTVVWLDADSVIVNPIEDTDDYDIGFRAKPRSRKSIKLKAGAVYMRDTEGCRKFLNMWLSYMDSLAVRPRGDQSPMNALISRYHRLTPDKVGQVLDVEGVRVKIFDRRYLWEVNTVEELRDTPKDTKVIHFRGDYSFGPVKLPAKMELLKAYNERNI